MTNELTLSGFGFASPADEELMAVDGGVNVAGAIVGGIFLAGGVLITVAAIVTPSPVSPGLVRLGVGVALVGAAICVGSTRP